MLFQCIFGAAKRDISAAGGRSFVAVTMSCWDITNATVTIMLSYSYITLFCFNTQITIQNHCIYGVMLMSSWNLRCQAICMKESRVYMKCNLRVPNIYIFISSIYDYCNRPVSCMMISNLNTHTSTQIDSLSRGSRWCLVSCKEAALSWMRCSHVSQFTGMNGLVNILGLVEVNNRSKPSSDFNCHLYVHVYFVL